MIAPARTGKDNNSKTAVTKTDQGKRAIRSSLMPKARRLTIVVIKFNAPINEEIPAKCNLKIAKSTEGPA